MELIADSRRLVGDLTLSVVKGTTLGRPTYDTTFK